MDDKKAIQEVTRVFEADWALTTAGKGAPAEAEASDKAEAKQLEVGVSA